jgi:hypothetical protein
MKENFNISLNGHRLIILALLLTILLWGAVSQAVELRAAHHIQIELIPDEAKLVGQDDIAIKANGSQHLIFHLSENLNQVKVEVDGNPRDFDFKDGRLLLILKPYEQTADLHIKIHYAGIFDDPVPVRPVNMDNPGYGVTGSISPRGSFLLAGAGWYPELIDGRSTYRVTVSAPAGMIAVTAGRSRGHETENGKTISDWEVDYPVQGLALSVARYVVEEKSVGKVTAATYLLPQNKHLAASYLNATAGYIALYSDLFGPYPFQKFAVVENFFPTGFGFPSYTLMGGSVLRLPFIVQTSLGHEIAHCWWGNGVYVDYAAGNWSEGLTSYVSDYLYKEMKSVEAAREYRRQLLRNFSTLVSPENDFALSRFQSRYDPVTKAIGYDKGAMIFHMIRRVIGEEAFWGSLRDIFRDRLFQRTSWSDFQRAFEKRGKRSLQNFFDQWIYRPGAPRFSLEVVSTEKKGHEWKVAGRIIQEKPYYSLPLALALKTGKQTIIHNIEVSGAITSFELSSDSTPLELTADPADDILRWLYPSEIPPAVNSLKSAASVLTILPDNLDPALEKAGRTLALSLGLKHNQFITEDQLNRQMLVDNDILLIGHPRSKDLLKKIPPRVDIRQKSFALDGVLYNKASDAFFGIFHHPYAENRLAALFMPLSSEFADVVAAKITHYGKYSYLTFQSGKNRDKGFWPVVTSPLVYKWAVGIE